jgi:hypothetical protein
MRRSACSGVRLNKLPSAPAISRGVLLGRLERRADVQARTAWLRRDEDEVIRRKRRPSRS